MILSEPICQALVQAQCAEISLVRACEMGQYARGVPWLLESTLDQLAPGAAQ